MIRMYLVGALVGVGLSGCVVGPTAIAVIGGIAAATDAYCTSTTEDAKQKLRSKVSDGKQVLACETETN